MRAKFKLALAMLAVAISAVVTQAGAADVVGTWRIISWSQEETDSKVGHSPFGDHPIGSITYTSMGT